MYGEELSQTIGGLGAFGLLIFSFAIILNWGIIGIGLFGVHR